MDKKENEDKISIKGKNINKSKKDNRIQQIIVNTKWDEKSFLYHCEISKDDVKKAKLTWEELAAIYEDHHANSKILSDCAKYIIGQLQSQPIVHSVRFRIKDGKNLIKKIIRKNVDEKRKIDFENYTSIITDLIGLRALHLFKEDWPCIHKFLQEEWDLLEKPTAYIREGDREEISETFKSHGCEVQKHPRNYRSVHYLISTSPSKRKYIVEIQVRTLFEEGWSEIDHRFNYPKPASKTVRFFLEIFNRLAGSADEMGSFINLLTKDLVDRDILRDQLVSEKEGINKKLNKMINKLEISETQRKKLQEQVDELDKYAINERLSNYPAGSIKIGFQDNRIGYALSAYPDIFETEVTNHWAGAEINNCGICGKPIPPGRIYCDECSKNFGGR